MPGPCRKKQNGQTAGFAFSCLLKESQRDTRCPRHVEHDSTNHGCVDFMTLSTSLFFFVFLLERTQNEVDTLPIHPHSAYPCLFIWRRDFSPSPQRCMFINQAYSSPRQNPPYHPSAASRLSRGCSLPPRCLSSRRNCKWQLQRS